MQDGIDQEPLPNIDKPILPFNPLIPFKQELIVPANLPKVSVAAVPKQANLVLNNLKTAQ